MINITNSKNLKHIKLYNLNVYLLYLTKKALDSDNILKPIYTYNNHHTIII